ncbi:AraC-like DNA-binding protein [Variovorax boronicumulans]|uniref:helix-turn-helix domain-containing protein n=1 Tax=Variovorax boronicumulans TaxID=436515 RepID=UPI0027800EE8|nr:AraC family transcriptional regulator [Variovorax boronicumulans]MDP9912371.1 AraC-like DNA-binding protein [Variovorax boronicumulans]
MYSPAPDGFSVHGSAVRYTELKSTDDLSDVVHCYWELRTLVTLPEDFQYHALPDACVNLLFDLVNTEIAGITALGTAATTLNLGTSFHYVGVQLYPGVWQGDRNEILNRYVGTPYQGTLPLVQTNRRLVGLKFEDMTHVLDEQVRWCIEHGHICPNNVTARILSQLDSIRSVADMATMVGLSPRQLQRTLKRVTGFAPHDLLKVLRVQQSFRQHYLDLYADQAHFTHAFRQAIGYTPMQYRKRFGV